MRSFFNGTILVFYIDIVKEKTMLGEFPIYYAEIATDDDGITCVSLVDYPAVKSNFVAFGKHDMPKREALRFATLENEEQHLLLGVIMRADYPIYRNEMGEEFYIVYSADTIRHMAEKMLYNGYTTSVNLQHDGKNIDGVNLQELFIKDSSKGIVPKGFEDIEDGSLFGVYKVHNEEVWQMAKRGECAGFSLEGFFHLNRKEDELKAMMAECEEIERQLNELIK